MEAMLRRVIIELFEKGMPSDFYGNIIIDVIFAQLIHEIFSSLGSSRSKAGAAHLTFSIPQNSTPAP